MKLDKIDVIYDHKQQDRFIDILYICEDCDEIKIGRYKEEYFFCNFSNMDDLINYRPCMDNREIIWTNKR
jgi:hypothetical protein